MVNTTQLSYLELAGNTFFQISPCEWLKVFPATSINTQIQKNILPFLTFGLDRSVPDGKNPIVLAGQIYLLGLEINDLKQRFPSCNIYRRGMRAEKTNGWSPRLFRHSGTGNRRSLIIAQSQIARMFGEFPRLEM